jgi:Histidine kinase-, DNA gyrase B-, and HSP90-like ATPase
MANAYDADATWVTVKTDAPRFSRITIEDNGLGMSPATVVHLLHNIGGSAKRTEEGQSLGIANQSDPTESPGGRKLIGKLGIGIFSVSQLTHSFQIITKTRGDDYRTVVVVKLRQFADEARDGNETDFEAGRYQVWREKSFERESQGTTIVLTSIRPQTRDSLRSEQIWSAIDNPIEIDGAEKSASVVPLYHIGRVMADDTELVDDSKHGTRKLPWDEDDDPATAFAKMVNSVWEYLVKQSQTAKLANIFDAYLQMIWNLALSLPLPYVERNVLDETVADDWAYFYRLSNDSKGSAQKLNSSDACITVAQLGHIDVDREGANFDVFVDGLLLKRPLKFRSLPGTRHVLTKPMVFVGSLRENFDGFDRDVSAGPLAFNGYLFWTPKVAPTEHQGVLVRIHGASGTLFDSTFFNYQVSELTRLRQITCEIFVSEGLEAALNIDRESFNTSHPHTVLLTRWVHSALRQLATAQKREAQLLREAAHATAARGTESRIEQIIDSANRVRTDGEGVIPDVRFTKPGEVAPEVANVSHTFELDMIVDEIPGPREGLPSVSSLQKLEAITKVLAVYGVLDQLSPKEQQNIIGSILGILESDTHG